MAIIDRSSKQYELPKSQQYFGRIIDVVEFKKDTSWQGQVKRDVKHVTIVWVLNAVDSEGRPFRAQLTRPQSMDDRSNLYKDVSAILGTAPPVPFDTESLIGVGNLLYIQQEPSKKDPTKIFANIKTIMPVMPAQANLIPSVPSDFTRDKNLPTAEQRCNRVRSTQAAPQTQSNTAQAAPAPQPPVTQAAPAATTVQF